MEFYHKNNCSHGGPGGSGCSPGCRLYFDPSVYRVIFLDQRGAGKSKPRAEIKVYRFCDPTHFMVYLLQGEHNVGSC